MAKRSCKKMLGLGYQDTDSAIIRKKTYLKVTDTQIDVLVFIWQYAQQIGIIKADIVRKYDLRSQTLTKVERGEVIERNVERYVDCLVRALNNERLYAIRKGNNQLAADIMFALGEICLVRAGVATDHEMVVRDEEEETARWREKMVKEGVLTR